MTRVRLIFAFCFVHAVVLSQYIPNNGQAFQFASIYNPAFTGIDDFTDLKIGYRNQWSGYGANAPKFINVGFNTRIRQPLDLKVNSIRLSKPSLAQPHNLPKKKRIIHGLSVNLFQSQFGSISQVGVGVGYSFNYPVSKKIRIAAGVTSLIENRKLKIADLTFEKPDPFYQYLLSSPSSQTDYSLRTGVLVYASSFYVGASYLSLINQSIKSSDIAFEDSFYRAALQAGYAFNVSRAVVLKPSTLIYLHADKNLTVDYNVKTYFADKGWIGITYRNNQTGIGSLGLNVSAFLHVSYSYEVPFGDVYQFTGSSHDILLGFRINNFRKNVNSLW
jgi:type IX secretion system PorP/SprF family membrane protein